MFVWFLLLLFYIPLQIALNPAAFLGRYGPRADLSSLRVFIVLFFLIWLGKKLKDRKLSWRQLGLNLQGVSLVLFLIFAGLSLFQAENVWWGLRKILFFSSVFPLFFLTNALIDGFSGAKRTIRVLIQSAFLLALLGLGQFLFQFVLGLESVYEFWALNIVPVFSGFNLGALILAYPSWLVNIKGRTIMRTFSLFSDPHIFSLYLGLTLPLALSLTLLSHQESKKQKAFLMISCLLFYVSALLSFARGAYLALASSISVLAYLVWKYLDLKKTALFLCCLLLVFVIPFQPISDRFYSSFDLKEGSNLGRLEMWKKAAQLGWQAGWWGIGLGNYTFALESGFDYYNPLSAHNLYLDIFSEIGVPGLLVWTVLIFGSIGQLLDRLKRVNFKERTLLIGLIGTLVYLAVHSIFETGIYHPSLLALLMVVLGMSRRLLQETT